MSFEKLGPLLEEKRTTGICAVCNNYIYRRVYYDELSKNKRKVIFVCKNCLKNNSSKIKAQTSKVK
ncbi:MAG: hypothetical protein ACTSRH_00680 [Promethearchaeota archaeon]